MNEKNFVVPNISCGHCVHTVEMELGELPGVTAVKADEASKRVHIAWQDPATWEQITALLQDINYPPEGLIQIN